MQRGKNRERICMRNGPKRVNQAMMCLLGGSSKNGRLWPLPSLAPKLRFALQKPFLLKTRINLGVSATTIRNRIGNSSWRFQILGKKFDRKCNSGRFCACAAENWLIIPEIVVQFSKFLLMWEIGHGANINVKKQSL